MRLQRRPALRSEFRTMSKGALWKGWSVAIAGVCWSASCWEIVRRMSTVSWAVSGWSEVALWLTKRVMTAEKMPDWKRKCQYCGDRRSGCGMLRLTNARKASSSSDMAFTLSSSRSLSTFAHSVHPSWKFVSPMNPNSPSFRRKLGRNLSRRGPDSPFGERSGYELVAVSRQ